MSEDNKKFASALDMELDQLYEHFAAGDEGEEDDFNYACKMTIRQTIRVMGEQQSIIEQRDRDIAKLYGCLKNIAVNSSGNTALPWDLMNQLIAKHTPNTGGDGV